jgi:hypothetical protein
VRLGLLLLAIGATATLSACGSRRETPPDVALPQQPNGTHPLSYPKLGVRIDVPDNWRAVAGDPPLVTTVASGAATVAIWRYPRSEALPRSSAALRTARRALVGAARARDRTLKLVTARVVRVRGGPAIELAGTETVGGEPRRVRSTHLYRDRSEVVVEALAPAADFDRLTRSVFDPVLASLRLSPLRR